MMHDVRTIKLSYEKENLVSELYDGMKIAVICGQLKPTT